jgi:hypothetical protein
MDVFVEETAMVRVRESMMTGAAVGLVLLGMVCGPAAGRDVKLAIRPQRVSAEAAKYSLLPSPASLTDGDAVPLYEKAVQALPGKKSHEQVRQYLRMPIEQMPLDEVEPLLQQYVESFKCVAQAVRSRECKWPGWTPGAQVANLTEYGQIGLAIRLWARYEIAQENYEGAVLAMRTGFGMGRHSTQVPTLVQFLTGVMIDAAMLGEVGEFMQAGEAPNLYAALAALPRPFTEVEKVIESEKKAASSAPSVSLGGEGFDGKTPFDGVRILAKRVDTDLAALQCVEAIRSYAASHGGQLPQTLAEITEVPVPQDPMSGAAFRYTRTGAGAVLEPTIPAGVDAKGMIRCEITVKN